MNIKGGEHIFVGSGHPEASCPVVTEGLAFTEGVDALPEASAMMGGLRSWSINRLVIPPIRTRKSRNIHTSIPSSNYEWRFAWSSQSD